MRSSVTDLPQAPSLAELSARQPLALFLDFDGTLVEIAERPDAIVVSPVLANELSQASAWLGGRLAVVSGRSVAELRRYLRDPEVALAGSHGNEIVTAGGIALVDDPRALDPGAAAAVRAFARRMTGLLLEEKPLGLALHYRSMPALEPQVREFAEQVARDHPVSLKRGKCVIEFVVPGTSKATAIERLMTIPPFTAAVPVFVGDDETDEDGFAAAMALGGFGIAVGERASRGAAFRLATPASVREWLRRDSR